MGKFYTIPREEMKMLDRTKVSMDEDHYKMASYHKLSLRVNFCAVGFCYDYLFWVKRIKGYAFQEQALMIRKPAIEIIKDANSLDERPEFDLTKFIICKFLGLIFPHSFDLNGQTSFL